MNPDQTESLGDIEMLYLTADKMYDTEAEAVITAEEHKHQLLLSSVKSI